MGNLRKKDYILFFIVAFLGLAVNVTSGSGQSIILIIGKILLASVCVSAVFGTLTNLLFRRRNT